MRHYPPSDLPLATTDNIFTVVDDKPYLVGSYADMSTMVSIDRGLIQNQLVVETTDPHLSVIDIVIDRIGQEPLSNESNYLQFLESLTYNSRRINGVLEVIRPGIEVTLEYELTSEKNGTLVRRANATMFIRNRQSYLDGSNPDPATGAIFTNFIDSTVKTITDRAYGSDRLVLTFTRLTVAYHVVTDKWACRQQNRPVVRGADLNLGDLYSVGITERERYLADRNYSVQPTCYDDRGGSSLYRFQDCGRSIWLHRGEIDNPYANVNRIILGSSTLNKAFIVGGGHRVEMRFSVWTSSEAIVKDTSKVYRILENDHCHHHPICPDHHHHDRYDPCDPGGGTMAMISEEKHRNDLQECDIRYLNSQVDQFSDLIKSLAERLDIEVKDLKQMITDIVTNGGTTGIAPDMTSVTLTPEGKLTLHDNIIEGTSTKVTFNKFGLIVGSSEMTATDIPDLPVDKVKGLESRLTAIETATGYTLPVATDIVRGGVVVPADNHGLTMKGEKLTLEVSTTTTDGAMSHVDKAILDSLVSKVAELETRLNALQPSP